MRDLTDPRIDRMRLEEHEREFYGGNDEPSAQGSFRVFHRGRWFLCIASSGGDWDHVSVSCRPGLPGWYDLEYIKRLFFKDDETAMQLHVPESEHVSVAEVLHLWRPQNQEIPRPPSIMVAPADGLDPAKAKG